VPLITTCPTANKKCKSNCNCQRKIKFGCPIVGCNELFCSLHYNKRKDELEQPQNQVRGDIDGNEDDSVYSDVSSNVAIDSNNDREKFNFDDDNNEDENKLILNEEACAEYILNCNNNIYFSDEDIDDESSINDSSYNNSDDNKVEENQWFNAIETTTPATNTICLEQDKKNETLGLHVIMNNVGSLLRRKTTKFNTGQYQKYFLQKMISRTPLTCYPLIYPEGKLFPSIFWSDGGFGEPGLILGAIPSGLLTDDKHLKNIGFASLSSHFKSRINNSSLGTSTNEKYISFAFDSIINLECRQNDTRMILHRGVNSCGLHPKKKKLTI
jgi:hypothetical protein